jgi:hypothetical protein
MLHCAGQIAENATGIQIHANMACRRDKHVCLVCEQKVFLREGRTIRKSGKMMKSHFVHSVKNIIKCSGYKGGETQEHLEAKKFVADHIEHFRFIYESCDTCHAPNRMHCVRFDKEDWAVRVEGQIKGTGTGTKPRRADILIQVKMKTDCIRLKQWYSIEIRHSHAVSMEKTMELHSVGCGIFEVLAPKVLEFKEMSHEYKPFYIRNMHNMCRVPWTCKTCMEIVSNERMSRWIEYDEWYEHQWLTYDILKRMEVQYRHKSDEKALKVSQRKRMQAQAFQQLVSLKWIRYPKTLSKYVGKCVTCRAWICHSNYHTFHYDDLMTETELWWHDAIKNDDFLSNLQRVRKIVYCSNCVSSCFSCDTEQPVNVLQRYGLCRFCNTDDEWFAEHN